MLLISVILIAHKRKQFIIDAISSLENQTLGKESFEVIVVKNFSDEKIDKRISDAGFRLNLSDKIDLSGKLLEGIELANGSIITILEDDDCYCPNRLAKIRDIFLKNKPLFYHNNFYFMNERGEITGKGKQMFDLFFTVKSENAINLFRKSISSKAHHNLSSMAFKKELAISFLKENEGLNSGIDVMIFLTYLASGGLIFLDAAPLTCYRRHASASNLSISFTKSGEIGTKNDLEIYAALSKFVQAENDPMLLQQVNFIIYEKLLYLNIKNNKMGKINKIQFGQVYSLVLEKLHSPEIEFFTVLFLFYLSKLDRNFAKRLLSFFATIRYKV